MALTHPAPAHIALALIIARSKPADSLIEDYIDNLQQIIVDKKRQELVVGQQYIDGTLFWKQAYEKSEAEKSELQDKIFQLEQQLNAVPNLTVSDVLSPAKRKSEAPTSVRANTQSKRRRLDDRKQDHTIDSDAELDSLIIHSDHITPLRALCNLRQISVDIGASPSTICRGISSNCHILIKCLTLKHTSHHQHVATKPVFRMEQTCKMIRKAWVLMLDSMTKLTRASPASSTVNPECVPDMIFLFQTMLGQLHQYCLDEADRLVVSQKHSRGSKTQRNKKISPQRTQTKEQERSCKAVSITMAAMFTELDLTIQSHFKLFEGLISSLLDHIGSALSLTVFGDPLNSKLAERGICTPQGLLDVGHIDTRTALETIRLASRFLINVLHKATSILRTTPTALKSGTTGGETGVDNEIVSRIRKRLQCTLLRGIFDDEDEAYESAFPRVERPIDTAFEELSDSAEYEKDPLQWFASQIWEHLGWDILVTEGEYPDG